MQQQLILAFSLLSPRWRQTDDFNQQKQTCGQASTGTQATPTDKTSGVANPGELLRAVAVGKVNRPSVTLRAGGGATLLRHGTEQAHRGHRAINKTSSPFLKELPGALHQHPVISPVAALTGLRVNTRHNTV